MFPFPSLLLLLLLSSTSLSPSLPPPLPLSHSAFLTTASQIFSLRPSIQTNAAARPHTTRRRPGAQCWLGCMAFSRVLEPACHSAEERGRRSVLGTATGQRRRPVEPAAADPRGCSTFRTRVLWANTWILIFRRREENFGFNSR